MFKYRTEMRLNRWGETLPQLVPYWQDDQRLDKNGRASKGLNPLIIGLMSVFAVVVAAAVLS